MNSTTDSNRPVQQMAKDLSTFAIDRTDLKTLVNSIPEETDLNRNTIEYELSILKILSTGWAISFYLPASDPKKAELANSYWTHIRDISHQISTLAQTTTGHEIDYFDILKQRLDNYMQVMKKHTETKSDPAAVMGPAFASACSHPDDAVVILIGTKMFSLTMGAVKTYIDASRPETGSSKTIN